MKKILRTGKKVLSVFMATLMVMTAWVFVVPEKAEAAVTSGKYTVGLNITVTERVDKPNVFNPYKGFSVNATNGTISWNGDGSEDSYSLQNGLTIIYRKDNGTGEYGAYNLDLVSALNVEADTSKTIGGTIPGYPIRFILLTDGKTGSDFVEYDVNSVYIGSSSNKVQNYATPQHISGFRIRYDLTPGKKTTTEDHFSGGLGVGGAATARTPDSGNTWKAPKATTIYSTSAPSDITLKPTGEDINSRTITYNIKDQYGVIMSDAALKSLDTAPTYTLTCSNYNSVGVNGNIPKATSKTASSKLFYTYDVDYNSTSYHQIYIVARDSFRSEIKGVNEHEVKLTINCGGLSKEKTFNIYDPKLTITYDKNSTDSKDLSPTSYDVYYGESLESQHTLDNVVTYPSSGSITLWPGHTMIGMYDKATGGNLMDVNATVKANKTYYAHWEDIEYMAVFLNRKADNVVHVESGIKYGDDITAVAAEVAQKLKNPDYDDSNHYTFNHWGSYKNASNAIDLSNITSNKTSIYPVYDSAAHTFSAGKTVEANCQHGPGTEYTCTVCGYKKYESTGDADLTKHVKSSHYIVDREATCTEAGEAHYFCTVCGASLETVTLPAGHRYTDKVTKAATCIAEGVRTFTCSVCGDVKTEAIAKIQHNYVAGTPVAPDCTHSGYTPYKCSTSGCTAAYNEYDSTKPATAHNYTWTFSHAVATGTCACGETLTFTIPDDAAHTYTNVNITKQPTCAQTGTAIVSCSDGAEISVTLPKNDKAHSAYTTDYTEATCSAKGSVVTKCTDCKAVVSTQEIAKLNHSYDYVRTEPTCTDKGSIKQICANCGDVQTKEIPATGHKEVTIKADCIHGGEVICGVCKEVISTTEKREHDFVGGEETIVIPVSCKTDGVTLTKCKNCEAQQYKKITKLQHSWSDWTTTPATCTHDGVKTRTCSVCFEEEFETIEHSGHNYVEKVNEAATCTEAGHYVMECSKCGDVDVDTVTKPLDHEWNDSTAHEADCTHPAYTEYKCTRTGCTETKIDYDPTSAALGHDWSAWGTTKAATCTKDGEETRTCSRTDCDANETRPLPKTGHNMQAGAKVEATCTTAAYTPYTCQNNCGESYKVYDDTQPAIGHSWSAWRVKTEATNTTDGEMTRTCANCPEVDSVTIPMGGHEFDTANPTDVTPATCKAEGSETYKCTAHTNCGVSVTVTTAKTAHTPKTVYSPATCTNNGSVVTTCSVCSKELANTTINAYGHTWNDGVVTTVASCTIAGVKTFTCSSCNTTRTENLGKLDHTYTETGTTAADCLHSGYKTYKCDNCDSNYVVITDAALGHSYVAGTNTATCTAGGKITMTCSRSGCGATYDVATPATAHNYVAGTPIPATCAHGTKTTYSCTTCDSSYTVTADDRKTGKDDHKWGDWTTVEAATETSIGYKTRTCSDCGQLDVETIPASGTTPHEMSEEYTAPTCLNAGSLKLTCTAHENCSENKTYTFEATGKHVITTTVTAPQCGTEGSVKEVCDQCKQTIKTTEIAALNHDYQVVANSEVAATCQSKGSIKYECSVCHNQTTVEIAVNSNAHNIVADGDEVQATCTTAGYQKYKCENEGCTYNYKVLTADAVGHTPKADWEDGVAATCTTAGTKVKKCSKCGIVLETQVVDPTSHNFATQTVSGTGCLDPNYTFEKCSTCDIIKANSINVTAPAGHDYKEDTSKRVEPTNSVNGKIVYVCSECGDIKEVVLPAQGHTFEEDLTKRVNATCASDGKKVYVCTAHTDCGLTYEEAISKLAHTYAKNETTEATCTTGGEIKVYCSVCDPTCSKPFETIETAPLGHSYGTGVTDAPTCQKAGSVTYTCQNCAEGTTGHTLKTVLEKIPHNYVAEGTAVNETCTTAGYQTYKCTDCGDAYNELLHDPNGHSYETKITTQPTCTTEGIEATYCTTCDPDCEHPLATVKLAMLPHSYTSSVTQQATCAQPQITTYQCTGCDKNYTEITAVPLTNHTFAWVEVTVATPSTNGLRRGTCSVCGLVVEDIIPATGDHVFEEDTTKYVAPTCTVEGHRYYVCKTHENCANNYDETIPALGHDGKLESKAPTCTEDGYSRIVCQRSGCPLTGDKVVESIAIDKIGHAYNTEVSRTNATCKQDGKITFKCDRCDSTKDVTIAKNENAHDYIAGAIVTPATCVTAQYTTYQCKDCGKAVIMQTAPANGHTWDTDYTIDVEATCTQPGSESIHCSACEATKDARPISATGHQHTEDHMNGTPDCTTGAVKEVFCNDCQNIISTEYVAALGHDIDKTKTPIATTTQDCTQAETATYKCSRCDVTETVLISGPLGHDWGNWYISLPATDTDNGQMSRRCLRTGCDEIETIEMPNLAHTWNSGVKTKDPTCKENGETTYTCVKADCQACELLGSTATVTVKDIAKLEHTLTKVTVAPNCVDSGSVTIKCTECGYVATELNDTIPATGHNLVKDETNSTAATCQSGGTDVYKCTNAGCDYTESHNTDALEPVYGEGEITTPATCQSTGVMTYKCTNCSGDVAGHTKTEEIPKAGHNYKGTTVNGNCTNPSYKLHKCQTNGCTESYITDYVAATGHRWGDWETVTEATNEADGIKKHTCTNTGCSEVEYAPIPALGHEWNSGEWKDGVEPTCTTGATKIYTCIKENCPTCDVAGTRVTREEQVNPLGHDMDSGVYTPADCTNDSFTTYTCSRGDLTYIVAGEAQASGHVLAKKANAEGDKAAVCEADGQETWECTNANCDYTEERVLPALGHAWSTETHDPTCTELGYTEYKCANDSAHNYRSDYVTYAEHNYQLNDAKSVAATCTSDGKNVYTCANENCTAEYEVVVPGHHDYTKNTVNPTCTEPGYDEYTCDKCAEGTEAHSYRDNYVAATGHQYNSGVVVKEATAGNNGLIQYTCSVPTCGEKYYEEYVLDASVHQWQVDTVNAATCEHPGSEKYTCVKTDCTVCTATNKASFTKVIPATGHNYTSTVTTPPTCTEEGVRTFTCPNANCETPSYTVAEPAAGHSYTSTVVASTCTEQGYTKHVCGVCKYEMRDNFTTPLNHDMESVVTDPTCTNAGYTTHTCKRDDCGYSFIDTIVEAKGHTFDDSIEANVNDIAANCTTDGSKTVKCKDCDVTKTTVNSKTGHNWGEWVITTHPTATAEGEKTRTCANATCPVKTETVTLPKLNHTMVAGTVTKEPTCTETGKQEYVCTLHTGDAACGYTYEVTLSALGHDWDNGSVTTAATCTKDGIKTYSCKRDGCNETYTETVSKLGHKMKLDSTTSATCLTDEYETYICENGCGHTYTIIKPNTKVEHEFEVVEQVNASCTGDGFTVSKCKICDFNKTSIISATGHNWGDWQVVKEAGCNTDGLEIRKCLNDETHTQTRTISATGVHEWVPTVVKPSCTEMGFTMKTCTSCHVIIRTDFKPALGHDYDDGVYEQVTCDAPGGTRYTCKRCDYSYLVVDSQPLGHKMGDWYFTKHPDVENAYAKKQDCAREDCTYYEYECGEDGSKNVYYKVDYINDYITKSGEAGHFVAGDGTTLSKETADAYESKLLESIYVLKGDAAQYPSELHPQREKTLSYGAYKFTGWAIDQTGTSLDAVTSNITAHAEFEGLEVYYKVAFYNGDGSQLTTIQDRILHGHGAVYDEYFDEPTMPSNLHYKFKFKHWTRDIEGSGNEENSYAAIYSSGGFRAVYDSIPKQYKVIYHDWNGDVLGSETFEYSKPVSNAPTGLTRPSDQSYIYEFSGNWTLKNGQPVDLNKLIVPDTTWQEYNPDNEANEDLTDAQKGLLHVYANYYQKAKLYRVKVVAVDIDGKPVPGGTVQIVDPSGAFVAAEKLDSNSEVVVTLKYNTFYTFQITCNGNVAEKTVSGDEIAQANQNGGMYTLRVKLDSPSAIDPDHPSDHCSCICHTFFSRIWIFFLNIVFKLFGKKTVCCYDMYATHGNKLVYTQ